MTQSRSDLLPSWPPPPCPTLDPISASSLSGWDQLSCPRITVGCLESQHPCKPLSGCVFPWSTLASGLAAGDSHRGRAVACSSPPLGSPPRSHLPPETVSARENLETILASAGLSVPTCKGKRWKDEAGAWAGAARWALQSARPRVQSQLCHL